ncbi:site-specific integrase [Tolumonas lignilytica]|uniref:site-specific integrase n=1 Tax=Tolumonas lignilytica TaxID=1283284 RepID=UPI000464FDAC|nr:site-specific integrase [Tolumonas lignilytica]
MGSIRARNQQLFFDFRYQGVRCREQTLLKDTKMNRARLEKVMSDIDKAIHLGQFIYRDFFPGSARCTEFELIDTQTKQKQEKQEEHLTFVSNVPTFSKFSYEWMSENEVHWKQSHLANVKSIFENYLLPTFGTMQLDQITRADILKLRTSLAKGKTASQRSITNDRVNHIMTPLRCVLSEAALRFDIISPFHNIKPLKIGRSNIEPFSLTEVRTFLAGVRPDFRNYYAVRFFTGMRTAEIDGLRWKYVDLANRQIIVEETLVNGRQETPKTQASYRVIQISEPVYQALSHQYDETGYNDFVFCNEEGNPLDHRNVTKRIWNPTLAMLGLKRRRPYQTRHTTATLWLAAGENPEWIAKQLGHSTTKMLFEVYSRYVPNLTRQDGSAFNSLISCN